MKYSVFVLLSVFTCGSSWAQNASKPELKVTISSDVREIPVTGDVPISVEYQNLTDESITYKQGALGLQDVSNIFEVRGPDGALVHPRYDVSRKIQEAKWLPVSLGPKQNRILPNMLTASNYGFNLPGQYAIRVRRDSGDPSTPAIYSNTITIRVTDWDTYTNEEKIKSNLHISILPGVQNISVGDNISVEATFTNEGKQNTSCSTSVKGGVDIVNQLEIRDSSGVVVIPDFGPNLFLAAGDSWVCDVPPQRSLAREMLISSKAYGVGLPGSYTVRLCRGRYRTGEPTVCSNTIEVQVDPAKLTTAGE